MAENKLKSLQGLPKLNKTGGGLPKLGGLKKPSLGGTAKSDENKAPVEDVKDTVQADKVEEAKSAENVEEAKQEEKVEDVNEAASTDDKKDKLAFLNPVVDPTASALLDAIGGIDDWELLPEESVSEESKPESTDAGLDAKADSLLKKPASSTGNTVAPIKPIAPAPISKSGQNAKISLAPPPSIKVAPIAEPAVEEKKEEEVQNAESMLFEQSDLGAAMTAKKDPKLASDILGSVKPISGISSIPSLGAAGISAPSPVSDSVGPASISAPSLETGASVPLAGPASISAPSLNPESSVPLAGPASLASKPEAVQPFTPVEQMSEEEQIQALLASMTPEERAEYEAYSREQERLNGMAQKSGNKTGLIIGIVAGILVIIGIVCAVAFSGGEKEEEEVVVEAAPEPEVQKAARVELATYSVDLTPGAASVLFINGVETPLEGPFKFVEGRPNTVIAYADGMLPYFTTFEQKPEGPVTIEMQSSQMYSKGELTFRMMNKQLLDDKLIVKLDGQQLTSFPDPVLNVVLGSPHVLTVEHAGYASHMSIFVPDNSTNKINIPELENLDTLNFGTKCTLKKLDSKYRISMKTSSESYNSLAELVTAPGDMIEYSVSRDQRYPLKMSVIPDGYGSLILDAFLLHKSIGESVVSFTLPKKSTIEVCLRRAGEVICPDMKEETVVPSGPEWEMFGTEIRDGERKPMLGGQIQELQSSYKYVFDVSLDKRGGLQVKMKNMLRVKKQK